MHLLFILPLTAASAFSTRSSSLSLRTFVTKKTQRVDPSSTSLLLTHPRHYHQHPSQTQDRRRGITAIHESESGENGMISSNKMKVLGVCGGIGSGKSTACQLMVDSLGCVARIGKRFLIYMYTWTITSIII